MLRKRRHIARGEMNMEERRPREQDERHDRKQDEQRPAHDAHRDRMPPPTTFRVGLEDRKAQAVDILAEHRQQRGEEGQAIEHGARNDDRARDTHR